MSPRAKVLAGGVSVALYLGAGIILLVEGSHLLGGGLTALGVFRAFLLSRQIRALE
jgi:hypothetical protein